MNTGGPALEVLIAGKGYGADSIRDDMDKRGGSAMVPVMLRNRPIERRCAAVIPALAKHGRAAPHKRKSARRPAG